MDSSLHEVWQAAAGSPFVPAVGKDSQFLVASVLLVLGLGLGGAFTLSMSAASALSTWLRVLIILCLDRSVVNLPVLAVPASLALAYVDRPVLRLQDPSNTVAGLAWSTCSVRLEFTSKIPKPLAESVP
jgi:hypothetical protein